MEYARQFKIAKTRVKIYDAWSKEARKDADRLEAKMLQLIEDEKLPESFKIDGKPVYTSDELWASPRDGDHAALVAVLESHGLRELLPKSINSQSLSGWVREFRNDMGELVIQDDEHPEGLPRDIADSLKITERTRVKINGL